MSSYNVDLMLAVREQITSHPETHDQRDWARRTECGTMLCIAGWACQLSGEQLRWFSESEEEPTDVLMRANYTRSGERIETLAGSLMGLTAMEAGNLFHTMSDEKALAKLDELIEKGKNQP